MNDCLKKLYTYLKNTNDRKRPIFSAPPESRRIPVSTLLRLLNEGSTSFYIAFLEAYPDFSEKLLKINPAMKFSDIEFCAYIKLNLETKQIAQFKKISTRAVEGKKYRIRKKLNIPPNVNMYIWMSRL